MKDLNKLSIAEAISSLKKKDFKVSELITAHINAAIKYKKLNAFCLETHEHALEKAKLADKNYLNNQSRVLEGIPVGVKDLFCTKNFKTTACSKMLDNFFPSYESTVTSKLFANGAIMIGKTNMDEFAMGSSNTTSYYGPVVNPWKAKNDNKDLVPGGSSGGSAASVASFTSMAALGSDTGGSIRQPASFTGVVGIKPSYGRCSRWGMIAFASSLDQAGVFTRSVEDAAIVLESIMGYDEKDPTSANKEVQGLIKACGDSVQGMKIGEPYEMMNIEGTNDDIISMWQKAIDILKNAGAEIVNIDLPNVKHATATYYIIASAEASSNLARFDGVRYGHRTSEQKIDIEELFSLSRTEGFGAEVKRRIMIGTYVLSASQRDKYYKQALKVRRLIVNDFKNAYKTCQAILLPVTPGEAFAIGEKETNPVSMYLNDLYTIPASLAGLPCISVPTSLSKNLLPLSMQVIANNFAEDNVFKISSVIEKAVKNTNFIPGGY